MGDGEKARGIKFDFSSLSFGGGKNLELEMSKRERQFLRIARLHKKPVMYRNALEFAKGIDIGEEYFAVVSGEFIFGDLVEALCDVHRLYPRRVILSTLGMSKNNVDSIVNLVDYFKTEEVWLIVSNYFYSTERFGLLPYMATEFMEKPISVGVCASHTKSCLIDSPVAGKIAIYGSANLSSSNNLEEFALTHDPAVYDFLLAIMTGIMRDFKIIDGREQRTRFKYKKIPGNTGKKLFKRVEKYPAEARKEGL